MSKFESPLVNVRIASPCQADWEGMYGDGRKRFCGDCNLNVYNLSGMTRDQAESLIQNAEGRLCVRYFQRADGTVITADCPVGWARIKQRSRVIATAALSVLMTLFSALLITSLFTKTNSAVGRFLIPFTTPTPRPIPIMGAIAVRPSEKESRGDRSKSTTGSSSLD